MMATDDRDRPDGTVPAAERVLNDATGGRRHGRSFVLNTQPLFKLMVEKQASDLFFTSNAPIKIKIEGQIIPVNKQVLTADEVRQAAYGLMTQEQIDYFQHELEIDFAISEPGPRPLPRRRVPPARQPRDGAALHHRRHAALDELGLPRS